MVAHRSGSILTGLGLAATLAVPLLALAVPGSGTVAVVGRPGGGFTASAHLVSEAGGMLVGAGRFGGIVVARSDEAGFARRLYAAGAWLVFHPMLAGGCAPDPVRPSLPQT